MLASILKNWKSTVLGLLAGTAGALAVTEGIDQMTPKEFAAALIACFCIALQGVVTKDAKKVE